MATSNSHSAKFLRFNEVDLEDIVDSLCEVGSSYARNLSERSQSINIFEIKSDGSGVGKRMTLRQLLTYINDIVESQTENENQAEQTHSSKLLEDNDNYSFAASFDGVASAVTEVRLRDLRRLDYSFNPEEEKSILIRRHAALCAMDPLRSVVMADRLIVMLPPEGSKSLLASLRKIMGDWNRSQSDDSNEDIPIATQLLLSPAAVSKPLVRPSLASVVPFEAQAYEALLTTVRAAEAQRYDKLGAPLRDILAQYSIGSSLLPIEAQENMRDIKNSLTVIHNSVSSSRHALHELTEDDEDMALMNLTYLRRKPHLYAYPLVPEILSKHDEMEELLESHILDLNSLLASIEYAREQIENAEDLVSLRLDTARNELLIANTALAVLACSIGFSAYLTGVFGMNLDNVLNLQPVYGVFPAVFAGTLALIPLLFVGICVYLRFSDVLPSGLFPGRYT